MKLVRPLPPALTLYNVSARLRNPLDDLRPFAVGGGHLAADDLAALDEFAVRVLLPFANAGFPVEVYSVTAVGRETATIVLPSGVTDDRRRHELAHAEHVLDLLGKSTGRKIDLRVIPWDFAERRPAHVAPIVNARRAARAAA